MMVKYYLSSLSLFCSLCSYVFQSLFYCILFYISFCVFSLPLLLCTICSLSLRVYISFCRCQVLASTLEGQKQKAQFFISVRGILLTYSTEFKRKLIMQHQTSYYYLLWHLPNVSIGMPSKDVFHGHWWRSACSPQTPTICVLIPLNSTIFL